MEIVKMKLAAAYNVWDGEELLEGSIRQIRSNVDKIIVIWQDVSYFGVEYSPWETLSRLKQEGLIDEEYYYTPSEEENSPYKKEIAKRNIGLQIAKNLSCTHYMSMDCDEYYKEEDFKRAKNFVLNGDYSSTACQLRTFYRKPTLQVMPPEEYYVSFIHKIFEDSLMVHAGSYPVEVDPSRGYSNVYPFYAFPREELEMYHYSFVRKDIPRKMRSSSAILRHLIKQVEKEKEGDNPSPYPGHTLIEVEDTFNLGEKYRL